MNETNNKRYEMNLSNYKLENYFKLPNPNVRGYFHLVDSGQPEVITTPWIKAKTNEGKIRAMRKIVKDWENHLSQLESKYPSLYEYEKDQAAKVGPMSVMRPLSERLEDVEAYYTGILLPAVEVSDEAIAATVKEFEAVKGLRMRDEYKTYQNMRKSTSSGTPFYRKKRGLPISEVLSTVDEDNTTFRYAGTWPNSAMLGWRGQEGGPHVQDTKQRVVWMFPTAVNVHELQVYQPLIEAFQRKNLVPAWVSMDAVDERITRLFDTKQPDDLIICTDFTKFDQHFNHTCQNGARKILESLMTPSADVTYWLNEIFPIKYEIPLLLNDHLMVSGEHGMGSGSGGTNADETLLHRALQHEAAINHNQVLNPNSMCLGDDGILTYPGITAKDVTDSYSAHGLDMNPTKQSESAQFCTYLRRWHHVDYRVNNVCVGVYPTTRALGRLLMQERFYDPDEWGPKMVALRELSIIENCKWHPLREEFADWCMSRDKYRLGIDIPGFLENIEVEAQKAVEHMPDFLGYTKSLSKENRNGNVAKGIGDWWIVKYLKSKA